MEFAIEIARMPQSAVPALLLVGVRFSGAWRIGGCLKKSSREGNKIDLIHTFADRSFDTFCAALIGG